MEHVGEAVCAGMHTLGAWLRVGGGVRVSVPWRRPGECAVYEGITAGMFGEFTMFKTKQ